MISREITHPPPHKRSTEEHIKSFVAYNLYIQYPSSWLLPIYRKFPFRMYRVTQVCVCICVCVCRVDGGGRCKNLGWSFDVMCFDGWWFDDAKRWRYGVEPLWTTMTRYMARQERIVNKEILIYLGQSFLFLSFSLRAIYMRQSMGSTIKVRIQV